MQKRIAKLTNWLAVARPRHIERLIMWIAWHLPRTLVMWCYVRVAAAATTGAYSERTPDSVNIMDALNAWNPPASN